MNASLARAIRGPIVLITVGTLFALDHFGGYSFGRTWPVLIIVIGLLKLMERSLGPVPYAGAGYYPPPPPPPQQAPPPPPPPPMGNVPPGGVL